ncbi:MAG: ABC-2 family transporter protein, partial [Candidatus Poribacteria bacterium]|nr:ABC-2 family transporter protein [Candidatus Poribacteria bacterium]
HASNSKDYIQKLNIERLLPLAFTSFYPATLFLERWDYIFHARMTPVIALLTCGIGFFIWKSGLRRYESTGS